MPKKLYLLRHAKSDWSEEGQRDFDRDLNARGRRDAPRMGQLLHELGVAPGLVVASPARRTTLTARTVAEALDYPVGCIKYEEALYEASVPTFLKVIYELPDGTADAPIDRALLVAHNPTITYVAEHLSGQSLGNIPTSGVVSLLFELDEWAAVTRGAAVLEWFEYPKKHD
ncbi:MAG: histidine phosphatase family protein [Catalinimonas sp.]